jgi:hypothetical protein
MAENNHDIIDGGASDDNQRDERKRKFSSLRSATANLKVLVGPETEREVFWQYSQILASQSGYVDTLLSTRLPTNDDSNLHEDHREVVFSDITPSQWKRMMEFLADPKPMTVEDAFELVVLYDQYEFKYGIKICDALPSEKAILKCQDLSFSMRSYAPSKVEQCVQAIVLGEKIHLRKTFFWGRAWLNCAIRQVTHSFPLSVDQFSRLVPTLVRDSELKVSSRVLSNEFFLDDSDRDYFTKYLDGDGEELGINLKDRIYIGSVKRVTTQELANPLLPELFLSKHEKERARYVAQQATKYVNVLAPIVELSGMYEMDSSDNYYCSRNEMVIWKNPDSKLWEFYSNLSDDEEPYRPIYRCRGSQFEPLPPKSGWFHVESNRPEDGLNLMLWSTSQ